MKKWDTQDREKSPKCANTLSFEYMFENQKKQNNSNI